MNLQKLVKIPLIVILSIIFLNGCDAYMWRQNVVQLNEVEKRSGQLQLNTDHNLMGSDTDLNGIRDDIDLYIAQNFKQIEQQRAVSQYAVQLQNSLLVDKQNLAQVKHISFEKSRAIGCIYEQFPVDTLPKAMTVVKDISAITMNTKIRFKAHLAFSQALDGTVMTLANSNLCNK